MQRIIWKHKLLIPDPDGLAQCLSKTMRPDSWIWDQETDHSYSSKSCLDQQWSRLKKEKSCKLQASSFKLQA